MLADSPIFAPYGELVQGSLHGELGFHSHEWHQEAELYQMRQRWYSVDSSRFLTRDPVRTASSAVYGLSASPVMLVDPMGELPTGSIGLRGRYSAPGNFEVQDVYVVWDDNNPNRDDDDTILYLGPIEQKECMCPPSFGKTTINSGDDPWRGLEIAPVYIYPPTLPAEGTNAKLVRAAMKQAVKDFRGSIWQSGKDVPNPLQCYDMANFVTGHPGRDRDINLRTYTEMTEATGMKKRSNNR